MSSASYFVLLLVISSDVVGGEDVHGRNTAQIGRVAKSYMKSDEFWTDEVFVYTVLKQAGARVNLPFSAESWGNVTLWGEDRCWKYEEPGGEPAQVGDVISNCTAVGIVTDVNVTTSVVDNTVQETNIGFEAGKYYVIWVYKCDVPERSDETDRK